MARSKAAAKLRALGLPQSTLAARLGLTQGAVSKLLSDERGGGGETRTAAWREFGIPPTDWDEEEEGHEDVPATLPGPAPEAT